MKATTFTALAMLALGTCFAQPGGREFESRRAEIEQKKIAYITTQLNLTTAEAQQFWPVYNAYQDELRKVRDAFREDMGRPSEWKGKYNAAQIEQHMRNRFAMERKKVDIDEKYFEKFKTVLGMEQVARYYEAEHEFRKEIMRSIRGPREELRKGEGPLGGPGR
jgi:hypothetical protein